MHTIHIIDKIDATFKGPYSLQYGDADEGVFLKQGSMDGACGYYSVMMALIINGVVSTSEATSGLPITQDGRTKLGKLTTRMMDSSFFEGTYQTDIVDLFDGIFVKELSVFSNSDKSQSPKKFIIDQLTQNNPVMIVIEWSGGAHWVVAVGMDFAGEGDSKELCRFLVLDPGGDEMKYCAWNGVLEARSSGGPYPYEYWGKGKVKIRDAVALVAL